MSLARDNAHPPVPFHFYSVPTSKTSTPPPRRGAPLGNTNALKHGFYTRRFKKSHLNGVESTDTTGLVDEIALIRVFTRRLVESLPPEPDASEIAEVLRILCFASFALTRLVRTQFLIASTDSGIADEISEAIRLLNLELHSRKVSIGQDSSNSDPSSSSPDGIPDVNKPV